MSEEEESFVILYSCTPPPSLNGTGGLVDAARPLTELQLSKINEASDSIIEFDQANENNSVITESNQKSSIKTEIADPITTNVAQSVTAANEELIREVINNSFIEPKDEFTLSKLTSKSVVVTSQTGSFDNINRSESIEKSSAFNSQTQLHYSKRPQSMTSSAGSVAAGGIETSLATSFILGEVDADVLKNSVFSQFPSTTSIDPEDVKDDIKLQTIISDNVDLKNTLQKVNMTMKLYYNKSLQWKEDNERREQEYKRQLEDYQKQIIDLNNKNLELQRELNSKMEHISYNDEVRQKQHNELVQNLSEKTAQIQNMRTVIEKLEQQQLGSFEYLPKNENDSKEKPDYVDRLEHQRVVKGFERQMSQLLAENLDLKDVQKQYIDEITCLKVNTTAAEELIKQLRVDIDLLKTNDMEKSEIFLKNKTERNEMRDEITLLRQQVDAYSKDFEMERIARVNIAGEKDQLLQDLRSLQRKNQELIEQAQKQWDSIEKRAAAAVVANPPAFVAETSAAAFNAANTQRPIRHLPSSSSGTDTDPKNILRCPICYKVFRSLLLLQQHVNICLDKN